MKTSFFAILICLLLSVKADAQSPVITSSSAVKAGSIYEFADLNYNLISLRTWTGKRQLDTTWDATAYALSPQTGFSYQFLPSGSVAGITTVPAQANLIKIEYPIVDTTFDFIQSNSNGIYQWGNYNSADKSLINFSKPLTIIPFPAALGGVTYDTMSSILNSPFGNISVAGQQNIDINSWGKVITPLGTFSALRLTNKGFIEGSLSGFPIISGTTERYEWYTPGYSVPLLTLEISELELPTESTVDTSFYYLKSQSVVGTSDVKQEFIQLNITPNPVSEFVQISIPADHQDAQLRILNSEGKVIYQLNKLDDSKLSIPCQTWPAGNYLLVASKSNGIWGMESFIKK